MKAQFCLARRLSKMTFKKIMIWGGAIFLIISLVPCIGLVFNNQIAKVVGKIAADVISPVSLRYVAYGGCPGSHMGVVSTVAYAIGIIIVMGIIVPIVTNYLRTLGEKYTNGTLDRYHWKDHIVFLGYDDLMSGTIRRLCQPENEKRENSVCVVVAVPDGVAALRDKLTGLYGDWVEVVQCNQSDPKSLISRARVDTARQIFIIGQPDDPTHDASNLASLGMVAALRNYSISNCGAETGIIPCMYYIRNQATFYLLHRHNVESEEFRDSIVATGRLFDKEKMRAFFLASEPFNVFESIARHLLVGSLNKLEGLKFKEVTDRTPHLVVIGMTPMGTALARMAMMTAHFPGKSLKITMVDENAYDEMRYFIGRHRSFFDNCKYSYTCYDDHSHDIPMPDKAKLDYLDVEVEFIHCNISHPELSGYLKSCVNPEKKESLAVAVCTDESPKNMAFALYLPRQILESRIPIWVFQNGDNSMNSFLRHRLYKSVHIFTPAEYGVIDRSQSNEWLLAKAVASGYDKRYSKSVTPWNLMQPKNKWSSLYGAISKMVILEAVGKTTRPIQLSKEEKDLIAVAEHNRWNTEKLLNGFVPTSQEQHDILKHVPYAESLKADFVHDDIRAFDHLDDSTKQKDYEQTDDVVNEYNRINA